MSRSTYRLVFALFIFYVVAATTYLLHRSFTSTRTSISLLQAGENALLTDPVSATKNFQLSEQASLQSLGTIRESRWWIRLISILPPLRWQVQLAKASYSLAEAGQSMLSLQNSLSNLNHNQIAGGDPLVQTANQYLTWYAQEKPTVTALQSQLATAQQNFSPIPAWIFLSQSDNFTRLQSQLATLTATIDEQQRIGTGIISLSTSPATALLVLLPANSTDPGSLGTLQLQNGQIQALNFQPLPSFLLKRYEQEEQRNAFWPSTAQAFALAKADTDTPADAVIVVDSNLIKHLLEISGPLQFTGVANPTISAGSWDTQLVSPDQLLYRLTNIALQPEHSAGVVATLKEGLKTQTLQLWSSNLELLSSLQELPDSQPPRHHSNWLRVIPERLTDLDVVISQSKRHLQQDTVQTLLITGGTLAPHIALPADAQLLNGAQSTVRSGYLEAICQSLADNSFTLSYILPRTINDPNQIHYLTPLAGSQKVTAFGQQKLITRDAVLTP